jgi:poly-beta-hydroxyalkanoate depolymerase
MSTSASKKRKSDGELKTESSPPIIFEQPGFNVDVQLNVFGQEFRVHSIILRLYSAYFRKFLDSADKKSAPNSVVFIYEYVSVVDDDGEWGLEAANLVCIYYSLLSSS